MPYLTSCFILMIASACCTWNTSVFLQPAMSKDVGDYQQIALKNWTILVESELYNSTDNKNLATSLHRLEKNLVKIESLLPRSTIDNLRKIRIYLLGGPISKLSSKDNGLEYFQKNAAEHHKNVRPEWNNAIVIYSAKNYSSITEFWSLKALMHEFAHAYHLQHWGEKHQPIYDTWKNAVEKKLYLNVKRSDGETIERAYAITNQLEYFAELSAMYFVGCDYAPVNRSDLKTYDPDGYAMVEKVWGVAK